MEKTPLTINDIRQELRFKYKEDFSMLLWAGPLLVGAAIAMTIGATFGPTFFNIALCVILWIIGICIIFGTIFSYFKTMSAIKRGKVYVDIDKLGPRQPLYEILNDRTNCVLCFERYGKYTLSKYSKYYVQNKDFAMNYMEIYKSSIPGDEFYIVTTNHKGILLFYNTRFWEYKEPDIKDLF